MKRSLTITWIATFLLILPLTAVAQQGPSGSNPTGGIRHANADRTAVFAVLQPADAEAPEWGRVMVATHQFTYGEMTELLCRVYELSPDTDYDLVFNGSYVAGTFTTDETGEGYLRLQGRTWDDGESDERNFPPIPEGLPAFADLSGAAVFMTGTRAEAALSGEFELMPDPPEGAIQPVFLERIRLVPMSDDYPQARGIARVAIDSDGTQYFRSSASGLIDGEVYFIEIDGHQAGQATANTCGHAELEINDAPGTESGIPNTIAALDEADLVQWCAGPCQNGITVLEGSFTGVNGSSQYARGNTGHGGNDNGGGGGNGGGNGGGH